MHIAILTEVFTTDITSYMTPVLRLPLKQENDIYSYTYIYIYKCMYGRGDRVSRAWDSRAEGQEFET